jgi:calnexin
LLFCLLAVGVAATKTKGQAPFFVEKFDAPEGKLRKRWRESRSDDVTGQWHFVGVVDKLPKPRLKGETGMLAASAHRQHAVSTRFAAPLDPKSAAVDKTLIVQYEVRLNRFQECGGAYIKLLPADFSARAFDKDSEFALMFGPDVCDGNNQVHFLVGQKRASTGELRGRSVRAPVTRFLHDGDTHLYTLRIVADDTFQMYIDKTEVRRGSFARDFDLAEQPTIADPDDAANFARLHSLQLGDPDARKPDDWDEDAPPRVPSTAPPPRDWLVDEPLTLADPTARAPDGWDDDEDGVWEGPLVDNPRCGGRGRCGPWTPPLVANPAYRGRYTPPLIANPAYDAAYVQLRIPNPDFVADAGGPARGARRLVAMAGVGFELWTVNGYIEFDNVYVDHSGGDDDGAVLRRAFAFADATWLPKHTVERRSRLRQRAERQLLRDEQDAEALRIAQPGPSLDELIDWATAAPEVAGAVGVGVATILAYVLVSVCRADNAPNPFLE